MIALFFLVSVAIGGVIWVFVYPLLSGERKVEKRRETMTRSAPVARATAATGRQAQKSRREQVEGSLKELEARRATSPPLTARISQAGLSWSKQQFYLISATLGIAGFLIFFLVNAGLLAALAIGFAAGFGLPMWILKFLKKRRESKFSAPKPTSPSIKM